MYLNLISLQEIQPCSTVDARFGIIAGFTDSIIDIMPYINAVNPTAVYNKDQGWISLRIRQRIITLYDKSLKGAYLISETDAYETLDYIKDMINDLDSKRDEIEPDFTVAEMPSYIDIYNLLPKLNCKKCGEVGCLAFSGKLLTGKTSIEKCRPLFEESYKKERMEIDEIMVVYGYKG
ncbi:(Fe-S)-binding protein [Romboutsia sedimentorum]|uniref:(Fe-S)-binding protein n=1 Tax=Romboutsia sedimentorum TaxID=1368474 RepID=UPI0024DE5AE0|nr:(Fe-S)-binding protein [Romboutsia sedimentorum]MDK2586110.1 (Fe-S)-binding protein [Romboutsia sedimentorum]